VRQSGAALRPPVASTVPSEEAAATAPIPMLPPGSILFPLSSGQCTSWAYYKRPDIYDNRSLTDTSLDWNADAWAGHAEAEGLAVDSNPRVGDIVAWPQSFGPSGHVAYVEAVEPGASITISEMNTSGLPPEDYRQDPEGHTYEVQTLEGPAGYGFQFIHSR
jgi:surface antigen